MIIWRFFGPLPRRLMPPPPLPAPPLLFARFRYIRRYAPAFLSRFMLFPSVAGERRVPMRAARALTR